MGTVSEFGGKPNRAYNGPSEILYTIGGTNDGFGWTFESSENTYKPEEYDVCKKMAEDIIKEARNICALNELESIGFTFKLNDRIVVAFVDKENVSVINCNDKGEDIRTVFTQAEAKKIELNKSRIIGRIDAFAKGILSLETDLNSSVKKENQEIKKEDDKSNLIKEPKENKLEKITSFILRKQSRIEPIVEEKRVEVPSNFELLKNIREKIAKYGITTDLIANMTQPERSLLGEIQRAKKLGKTSEEIKTQLGLIGFYKDSQIKEQNVETVK